MATVDTLSCVAAIVSALEGGADLVQKIKNRRVKKWRLKERDVEQAVEEKILRKALIDGANQCQAASAERRLRYGDDFIKGDLIAISELKDVMIKLQTEVISALQIGRAVENATLDLLALQETVITNKANTLRAMNDLVRRIITAAPIQEQAIDGRIYSPLHTARPGSHRSWTAQSDGSRGSLESPALAGVNIPLTVFMPAPGIPERIPSRKSSQLLIADATPKRSLTKSLKARSSAWLPQIMRSDDNGANDGEAKGRNEDEQPLTNSTARFHRVSLHDSAIGSNASELRQKPSTSIASSTFYCMDEHRRESCATADSFENPEDFYKDCSATQQLKSTLPNDGSETCVAAASQPYSAGTLAFPQISSPSPTRWESPDDVSRADCAPEVVTEESESMVGQYHQPRRHRSSTSNGYPMQNIHPAFRNPYTDDAPATIATEPDTIWAPLSRPAKLNDYHNFCKGAWQARARLEESLSISLLPNDKGQMAPYWKCKQCAFRSKTMESSNVLPDDISFVSSCGLRYRWAFLAKSHVHAKSAQARPEDYSFGCIFCAAQGSETAVYVGLDSLMAHVVAKHKTGMLTPEVLEKTRCLVGGAPGKDRDWDVNLPQSHQRKLSGKVGDFVLSAVTGLK